MIARESTHSPHSPAAPIGALIRVLLVGLVCVCARPSSADDWSAAVLMYHRFGETGYPSTSVPLDRFEQHLDWLQAEAFEIWPLSRLMRAWQRGAEVPQRVVAITVDDAYASVYHEAWPRLRVRGLPFTVFVATRAVDRGFDDMMSWAQMREMAEAGAEFANHSVGHDYLHRRRGGETEASWRQRIGAELTQAQQRLQAELGPDTNTAPRLFAYPYGEYSVPLMELLREQGYLAFGQHSGGMGRYNHPQALPRFPINTDYSDLADFKLKAGALALPVLSQTPLEPRVGALNPPELRLELGESTAVLAQLTCYATGQGRIPVDVEAGSIYRVQAPAALGSGRSRYNCTAPHRDGDRWYWYSQLWIRP